MTPEDANPMVQLTQTVQQLAQITMTTQGQGSERQDASRAIASRNLPRYAGQEDPIVLENWIRAFDKLLDAVNCPAERHIPAAVYYLE